MAKVDTLFVGATRPSMIMGIPYEAMILCVMLSAVAFMFMYNPLWGLIYLPLHSMAYLICQKDPRQFEHLKLWTETKGSCTNRTFWKSSSYSPLPFTKRKKDVLPNQAVLNREIQVSKNLPYSSHVSPSIIRTDNGDYIVIFRLAGAAHESADDETVDEWHESLNTLLRNMQSPELSIWSHTVRRKGGKYPTGKFELGFAHQLNKKYEKLVGKQDLMVNELYVTFVYRKYSGAMKLFSKLETTNREAQIKRIREDIETVEELAQQFETGLNRYAPQRLSVYEYNDTKCSEAVEFLSYLINGVWERKPLTAQPISSILSTSRPFFGKESFEIRGATESKVGAAYAIKEYPSATSPGYLNMLLSLPFEFTMTQSFEFIPRASALSLLKRVHGKMVNAQDDAVSQIAELEEAMDDVASGRIAMGKHHLSIILMADNMGVLNKRLALVRSNLSDCAIVSAREDLGLEAAFWAQLPANFKFRPRLAPISSRNFSGLSSFHNYPTGFRSGNEWGPAVSLFRTTSGTPYYFNFHLPSSKSRGDTDFEGESGERVPGNTLGIGPTGSGKTVFQTFTIAQMEKYKPTGVFFDKDRGAEVAIKAMGGIYLPFLNSVSTGLNPFQLEPTPATLGFLNQLVTKIITAGGKDITEQEREQIRTGIEGVMGLPKASRRLGMLMQFLDVTDAEGAAGRLKRWVHYRGESGEYAWVFDNETDDLDFDTARLFGFDMTEFLDNPEIRTTILMYLFHRLRSLMDGRKFWLSIDEFWKALLDEDLAMMAYDLAKTIRKLNGFIQLWTQNTGDVLKHPMGHAFIEQCVTHVYMPNPRAQYDDYVNGFQCSEREYEIIRHEMPESQLRGFLVKQGPQSAICELNLAGFDDELNVLSGTATTIQLSEEAIKLAGSNDPFDWLPIFHKLIQENENEAA